MQYQLMALMVELVQHKKNSINFREAKIKLCLSLDINGDESDSYVNKTKICQIKANDKISW